MKLKTKNMNIDMALTTSSYTKKYFSNTHGKHEDLNAHMD